MTIAQQLEQKGREKGRMEGKMEVARNLLAKGISPESGRELTGLSEDDLKKFATDSKEKGKPCPVK